MRVSLRFPCAAEGEPARANPEKQTGADGHGTLARTPRASSGGLRGADANGGAKLRRVAGRSKSAAPLEDLCENDGSWAAMVTARRPSTLTEDRECTRTWTSGWRVGEKVEHCGDVLEIETCKAVFAIESPAAGTIRGQLVRKGGHRPARTGRWNPRGGDMTGHTLGMQLVLSAARDSTGRVAVICRTTSYWRASGRS